METFFIKALQLVVALVLLVTIHEFGHYIFARLFGIRVNRFYLFFNPWFSLMKYIPSEGKIEFISWSSKSKHSDKDGESDDATGTQNHALLTINTKVHSALNKKGKPSWAATTYGLGWLPLGGYCDIAGMVDETKTAADLESEPQPWEFRSKAAWKRFMVMVAGVLFNFLLAIAIYAGIAIHWGDRLVPFTDAYEGMDYSESMHKAGFADGDILLAIDGRPADAKNYTSELWEMMQPDTKVKVLRAHRDTIEITLPKSMLEEIVKAQTAPMAYRTPVYVDKLTAGMPAIEAGIAEGDRIVKVGADTTPALTEFYPALEKHKGQEVELLVDRGGKLIPLSATLTEGGKLGIQLRPITEIYPVTEVHYNVFSAIPRGWELGVNQLTTYVSSLKLLFTKEGAQQVGGFGAIGGMFPDKWNWYSFWQITAFLSVILAFMNIIPIPALDGGYVMFLLWEMVTRRKPSDKFLEVANTVGFAFLLLLLLYANGNDILRAFR